jgi:hypothetical protein
MIDLIVHQCSVENSLTITIAFRAGGVEERISKEDETDTHNS